MSANFGIKIVGLGFICIGLVNGVVKLASHYLGKLEITSPQPLTLDIPIFLLLAGLGILKVWKLITAEQ